MRPPTTIVTTLFDKAASSGKFDTAWAWLLGGSRDVDLGGHRRADDSGGVLQGGGHHGRAVRQQRDPLVGLAADAATGDEQIGPDRVLDGREHPADLFGPALIAPAPALLDRRRRAVLGLLAANL